MCNILYRNYAANRRRRSPSSRWPSVVCVFGVAVRSYVCWSFYMLLVWVCGCRCLPCCSALSAFLGSLLGAGLYGFSFWNPFAYAGSVSGSGACFAAAV